jgi:glycosyltransferase involved in cell wall biosynthesis
MLAGADHIVVMSNRQLARFTHLGSKATVIYNAVISEAPAAFADATSIDSTSDSANRPVLGVVGRLSPEKGVDVFLDACAILRSRGEPFSARIAGIGPESDRLLAQGRRLGLEERVRFLGDVRDIAAFYRDIDVLVIPSRSEGLPNVLLEALGADRPVLATNVGAVAEVLSDPLAGLVVPARDPAALAAAVAPAFALLDRPEARSARAATAAAFSLDARVRRHVELYDSVLGLQ